MGEALVHPAGPKRVSCARFLNSAQAAQARHQWARHSSILPGRSESVVRGSSIDYSPGIFPAIDDVVGPSAVRSLASNVEGPAPRSVRNLQLGLRYSR